MNTYIKDFTNRYSYPEGAVDALLSVYTVLKDNIEFNNIVTSFYDDTSLDFEVLSNKLKLICEKNSLNTYTVQLLFCIMLTPALKKEYIKAGIDEQIFFDTVEDLKFKLMECYEVEKVWGVIPLGWLLGIFRMRTFALGRLEFNMGTFMGDSTTVAGRRVEKDDLVINIHIPSSGKPFDQKSRMDSYEKAYYFFKDRFAGTEPLFRCETWIIYPRNKEIFNPKSNVVSFMEDFKIVSSYEYSDNRNLWRIFGAYAELPPAQLPRNTSMQRAVADWLEKGNRLGAGVGIFVFDPKNKGLLNY